MIPDDVVGLLQGGALGSGDELIEGSHELGDLGGGIHTAHAVVAAGDDAQELAVGGTVVSNGHGVVTQLLLESHHVGHGHVGGQVGIAHHEACLVSLGAAHHSGLVLDGLGAVNEGYAALGGQSHGQTVTRDRLHDGGDHGDVHLNGGLLTCALVVLDQRGLQGDVGGNALGGGVPGDEQVLVKGMGGLVDKLGHVFVLLFFR